MTIDIPAITERYHRALDAKPGKGSISEAGIAAITDSVCDIPQMLAEVERLRDLTDQDALTREAIRLAEGSALSVSEIVESFKSMRDGEWKRRAVVARERAKAAEAALESWRAAAIENETIADDYRRHAEAQDRAFDRQLREALAEVDRLRKQNQRFASRLGGYATTMQGQLDPLFKAIRDVQTIVNPGWTPDAKGEWEINAERVTAIRAALLGVGLGGE